MKKVERNKKGKRKKTGKRGRSKNKIRDHKVKWEGGWYANGSNFKFLRYKNRQNEKKEHWEERLGV